MKQEGVATFRAKAAAMRYGNPSRNLRIIAVAGEAGKTTTACLIAELLKEAGRSVMLLTNRGVDLNGTYSDECYDASADSLQKLLAQAKKDHLDFVVLELTDELIKTNAIATLTLDTGVITGASQSSALLLQQELHYVVVPSDHATTGLGIAQHQVITYGDGIDAEAQLNTVKLYRKGTEISLTIDHQTTFDLATFLVGRVNALNVLAATAAAYVLSISLEHLSEGIARLELVSGNYQYIETEHPYSVAVDGARSDRSLELVMHSARELAKRRLIVVLEAGKLSKEALEEAQKHCDRLLLVSGSELEVRGADVYAHADEAVRLAMRGARQGDVILLVGSEFARRLENGEVYAEQVVAAAA